MDMISTEQFKLRYSEIDCTHTLKPQVLLNFMQDLASDNAEKFGFGYTFNIQNNVAWFLLKYHFEFGNYPEKIYNFTLSTHAKGYNKLFALRDFKMEYEGKVIGRATSSWGLIDLNTKSMVPISKLLSDNPNIKPREKHPDDLEYNKIKPIERVDREKVFEARFDDLDVNQHVNNSNYIKWALEVLNFDFRKTHKLKTLDMLFKKELKYAQRVISQAQTDGNTTLHVLKNADTQEELCCVLAKWIEK